VLQAPVHEHLGEDAAEGAIMEAQADAQVQVGEAAPEVVRGAVEVQAPVLERLGEAAAERAAAAGTAQFLVLCGVQHP
jgi:hypothetical protein